KMADENISTLAPTRSDDQILLFAAWTGAYSFQVDETRFVLDANLLREALEITPIDQAHQFVSPQSGDAIMDFVNELGYTEVIHFVSRMEMNNLYQPWREILFMINQCLTGKTSGSASLFHLAEEDLRLGNLKFAPKGKDDEVFGMPIPNELISNNIKNIPYFNAYLEIVAKHDRTVAAEKREKKKPATAKQLKSNPAKKKSSKPAPAPKPKVTQTKPAKPSPAKHLKLGKMLKTRKGKSSLQSLIKMNQLNLNLNRNPNIKTPATEEASTGPSAQPQDDVSANIVRESSSPADTETGADADMILSRGDTKIMQFGEEQGDDVDDQVNLEEKTARPDPKESRAALAGPNPEPTHDDFMANVYPNVHESLKFPANDHVIIEEPLSLTGALSSMKNLDDAYTIGDQFLNDKSSEDDLGKLNVEAKVVSMVIVPIYQAYSLALPLSTPVIDLSPPKPVSLTTQAPIFTGTTSTTITTLPLLPPLQQQITIDSELVARVTALEKKFSDFEQKIYTLDNTTQNLGFMVFTLELHNLLHNLPHKINQTVNEVVKEAIHIAFQAPLRDRFREQPEADMKEILHQRMFESGSYKSLPGHIALYEALEASMKRANMDEFFAKKDKSRKRRCNDQDPPPPPLDSDPKCYRLLTDQVDLVNHEGHRLVPDLSKLLPLGGPPGQVTIQPQFFFNKDLEYLISSDTARMVSLSISKLKAANYPDFGLEKLVPSLWIESERDYNINTAYGITHWWFKRKDFYITRHNDLFDRRAVRSQTRILGVISIKTFERYGYAFLKEIVIRRADYNEYKISEADFKNLHPNDFKDLYMLYLQGKLNHLLGLDKVHLYNVINLWIGNIVIRQRVGDLQLSIESYQTKKKMLRENEVYKFSDGTLTRVLHKLDHMVKDFRLYQYNPGMKYRIWSEDDKRRSKAFIKVIKRRLKTWRIFQSLESFVGGRLRDVDYRTLNRT
nr:histone deacetylase 14 [Tanacetum cinerariifolium]